MVVTIDSKFYSKLQLGISKYQEKTPADPLNDPPNDWCKEGPVVTMHPYLTKRLRVALDSTQEQ